MRLLSDAEVNIISELNRMRNVVAHRLNDNLETADRAKLKVIFAKYNFSGVSSFLAHEASFIDELKWSLLLLIAILMQRESDLKGEKALVRAPEPNQEFWNKAQLDMAVTWGVAHFDVVAQKIVEWLGPAVRQIEQSSAKSLTEVLQRPAIPPPPPPAAASGEDDVGR